MSISETFVIGANGFARPYAPSVIQNGMALGYTTQLSMVQTVMGKPGLLVSHVQFWILSQLSSLVEPQQHTVAITLLQMTVLIGDRDMQ